MQAISVKIISAIIIAVLAYDYVRKGRKFYKEHLPGTPVHFIFNRRTNSGIIISRKWYSAKIRNTSDKKIYTIPDYQIKKS